MNSNDKEPNTLWWRGCCVCVALLSLLTVTPLVTPNETFEPMLFGLPYTLWVSIGIGFLLWLFSCIGALVHPSRRIDKE